jgi:hypothetical protein
MTYRAFIRRAGLVGIDKLQILKPHRQTKDHASLESDLVFRGQGHIAFAKVESNSKTQRFRQMLDQILKARLGFQKLHRRRVYVLELTAMFHGRQTVFLHLQKDFVDLLAKPSLNTVRRTRRQSQCGKPTNLLHLFWRVDQKCATNVAAIVQVPGAQTHNDNVIGQL